MGGFFVGGGKAGARIIKVSVWWSLKRQENAVKENGLVTIFDTYH